MTKTFLFLSIMAIACKGTQKITTPPEQRKNHYT
jgi:hypothetical protein